MTRAWRTVRGVSALVVALAILAGLVACSLPAAYYTETQSETNRSIRPLTARELAGYLRSQHGDKDWAPALSEVRFVTKLGYPAIEVILVGGEDQIRAFEDDPLEPFEDGEIEASAYVQIWCDDGPIGSTTIGPSPPVRELPPAPASADEVVGWLDRAYGAASGDPLDEDWLDTVEGAELVTVAGGRRDLQVLTSLESVQNPREAEQAGLIIEALLASGLDWADSITVVCHHGGGMTTMRVAGTFDIPYDDR